MCFRDSRVPQKTSDLSTVKSGWSCVSVIIAFMGLDGAGSLPSVPNTPRTKIPRILRGHRSLRWDASCLLGHEASRTRLSLRGHQRPFSTPLFNCHECRCRQVRVRHHSSAQSSLVNSNSENHSASNEPGASIGSSSIKCPTSSARCGSTIKSCDASERCAQNVVSRTSATRWSP